MPKQSPNPMFVPTSNSFQARVDDFDELFNSDNEAGGAAGYYPRGNPIMGGGQGMMNPNMPRAANPNMNPNLNPNMRGQGNIAMGHQGMGPGQIGPGGNQMYPPQNMPAGPGRKNPGAMPGGVGVNPNFPQQKPAVGQRMAPGGMQGIQGQDMGFYGNFDDPQNKNQKGLRSANKGIAGGQRGYNDYGAYAEDDVQGYNNMDYGRGNAGPMAGGYPQHNRMGNNPQAGYGNQYKDEYQDQRGGFVDPMAPPIRNQGASGAGMRSGMGGSNRAGQMGNRYPMEEEGYYEEDYNEMDMMGQVGNAALGQQRGMGYDQGYDEYGNPYPAPTRNQPNIRNDYNQQYEGIPPQQPHAPQQPIGMGSLVQEPFTVEGSINSQTFDRKPGFDKNRKKVHTRERLRASLQKNKQTDPQKSLKKKPDSKHQGGEDGDRMNNHQQGGPEGKEPKREQIESDNEEGENNSRGYLEEEISSESNQKDNSQGSLEDHADMMNSEEGMRDK